MAAYAGLTEAQRERLEMLMEEAAEVVQCCAKILRHGYYSYNPYVNNSPTNQEHLDSELYEMWVVYEEMVAQDDLPRRDFWNSRRVWREKKLPWTHHQDESPVPEAPPEKAVEAAGQMSMAEKMGLTPAEARSIIEPVEEAPSSSPDLQEDPF